MENNKKTALVVTSIASPNEVLQSLAKGSAENNISFYVIGDTKSPENFVLEGCNFYSIEKQRQLSFEIAKLCPERHYTRKNIGYLIAIQEGADLIIETDDDNFPKAEFWQKRKRKHHVPFAEENSWLNIYHFFSEQFVWPRGFALEQLQKPVPSIQEFDIQEKICPIQQGLADENPDVDAIYRLAYPLPLKFKEGKIAIGKGSWCPFNSQNTTWFKEVFPLLYLPSYCSFRMTDIWRSFVAQRILWENDWFLLFHEPTVWQERNEHNLMKDFQDEIPGYLNNNRITEELENLNLTPGSENIPDNLMKCYNKLIEINVIEQDEISLLKAWLNDLKALQII